MKITLIVRTSIANIRNDTPLTCIVVSEKIESQFNMDPYCAANCADNFIQSKWN